MDASILIVLCNAGLVIALIAVIVLIALNMKPFKCEKKTEGPNTCLTITAKKNLDRVAVKVWMDSGSKVFERKRIRKGQRVDFVFSTPKKPVELIVEVEGERQRAFEV